MINETEGRPCVPCISISTVLFLGFIPLAGTNNIYYFSVIFLLRPPLTPSSFPPIVLLFRAFCTNPLILRATLSLSSFSRSSFSRHPLEKPNKSKGAGSDGISSQLIIDCADLIAPHIISITFNSSLAIMVYFLRIGSPQRLLLYS